METVKTKEFEYTDANLDKIGFTLNELANINAPKKEDTMEQFRKMEIATEKERKEIVKNIISSHLKIVRYIARKWTNNNGILDIEDNMQNGILGLMEAIDKYNYKNETNTSFVTFAIFYIYKSIRKEWINTGDTIRIPEYAQANIIKLKNIMKEYEANNKSANDLTVEKLAKLSNLSVSEVENVKCYLNNNVFVSLSEKKYADEDEGVEIIDTIEGNVSVEDSVIENVYIDEIKKMIMTLPRRQAEVLIIRLGFNPEMSDMTFEEIGALLGISKQAVKQSEKRGKEKLAKLILKSNFLL